MEMELTLLLEAADDSDKLAAVQRMRQEMRCAETMLRILSGKFVVETKSTICVSDLAEQWMGDARNLLPARSIHWDIKAGSSQIEVENGLLRGLLTDLL